VCQLGLPRAFAFNPDMAAGVFDRLWTLHELVGAGFAEGLYDAGIHDNSALDCLAGVMGRRGVLVQPH